jgi:hypothetical protein
MDGPAVRSRLFEDALHVLCAFQGSFRAQGSDPVFHFHIEVSILQFVEHLVQPFLFGFFPFRADNPSDVVIPLIWRTAPVRFHQTAPEKGVADKIGHGMEGSFEHVPLISFE